VFSWTEGCVLIVKAAPFVSATMLRKMPLELPGGANARSVMGETAIIPFFDIVAAPGAVRGSRAKAGEAGDGEANEAKLLAEMTFGGTSADETVELTMGVLWTDTT
jgi:hypothetical protein